jgi:multiple sugar transport system substrate-binding protein
MNIDRRGLLWTAASLPLATLLPRGARAATTINYWHHFTSATEFEGLERIVALFQEKHPDIEVVQENIPNPEWMSKVTAAVVSGSRPDTAMVSAERAPDMVAMGGMTDLTERIRAWPKYGEYPEKVWEGCTVDGSLYGIPGFTFVDWMYYRTDWFEEAGIAGPPKDFGELTDIAVKLTDPARNRYGFCMRGGAGGQALFMDMLHGFGLEPVVDGQVALDRAKLVEAMDWYTSLYTKLKVCQPSAPNDGYRQIMESFKTGQTGMIWHHTGSLTEIQQVLGPDQFMTATRPAGPEVRYARTTYQFNGVMDPRSIDAGFEWIAFWSEADAGIAMLEATGYFPSNPNVAKDERIAGNPLYAAAIETTTYGQIPSRFPGGPGWEETVVLPEFQKVLVGQTTVEAAADAILMGLEATLR